MNSISLMLNEDLSFREELPTINKRLYNSEEEIEKSVEETAQASSEKKVDSISTVFFGGSLEEKFFLPNYPELSPEKLQEIHDTKPKKALSAKNSPEKTHSSPVLRSYPELSQKRLAQIHDTKSQKSNSPEKSFCDGRKGVSSKQILKEQLERRSTTSYSRPLNNPNVRKKLF